VAVAGLIGCKRLKVWKSQKSKRGRLSRTGRVHGHFDGVSSERLRSKSQSQPALAALRSAHTSFTYFGPIRQSGLCGQDMPRHAKTLGPYNLGPPIFDVQMALVTLQSPCRIAGGRGDLEG
jgi:hypothetical protein